MTVYGKLQALLTAANTKTGESDTDLTAAVQTLIDGYGQGGGGGGSVKTGTLTLATDGKSISVTGIDFTPTHFVIFTNNADIPTNNSWHTFGYVYPTIGVAGTQINRYGASNWNASARAASYCSYSNGTISLSANYNFVAGITYYWAAW